MERYTLAEKKNRHQSILLRQVLKGRAAWKAALLNLYHLVK